SGPLARLITVGSVASGSFRMTIGSAAVPLQFRIVSGPRLPAARVRRLPGAIEEHSNLSACAGITRSVATDALEGLGRNSEFAARLNEAVSSLALQTARILTFAEAVLVVSCLEVARIVTVSGVGTSSGAV